MQKDGGQENTEHTNTTGSKWLMRMKSILHTRNVVTAVNVENFASDTARRGSK